MKNVKEQFILLNGNGNGDIIFDSNLIMKFYEWKKDPTKVELKDEYFSYSIKIKNEIYSVFIESEKDFFDYLDTKIDKNSIFYTDYVLTDKTETIWWNSSIGEIIEYINYRNTKDNTLLEESPYIRHSAYNSAEIVYKNKKEFFDYLESMAVLAQEKEDNDRLEMKRKEELKKESSKKGTIEYSDQDIIDLARAFIIDPENYYIAPDGNSYSSELGYLKVVDFYLEQDNFDYENASNFAFSELEKRELEIPSIKKM